MIRSNKRAALAVQIGMSIAERTTHTGGERMHSAMARHIDNVIAVGTSGHTDANLPSMYSKSWTRCMKLHGLDPTRPTPARILPSQDVREHQQRLEGFLRVARSGMEDMYRRVADLGYMLLLTDSDGITVDYIGNPASEQQLKAAGLYVGADWNEAHAGTCGVGTCLIERTTITCHQAEHFDATHIALTCTSAPLFAPNGHLLGVLDVSALHSPEARESQHLALHLTSMYAQMIEDANFLRTFSRQWILRLGPSSGLVEVLGDVMFAFDDDGVVLGANTGARRRLGGFDGARDSATPLIGSALPDLLDLPMSTVRSMARGAQPELISGLPPRRHERVHATVIAPRTRAPTAVPSQAALAPPHAPTKPTPRASPVTTRCSLDRLAGTDAAMQALIAQSKRLVDRHVNLLIRGETGAGKEVLARALHDYSDRAGSPFVAINCASIPESLIESELFGYTAGSFTGARSKGMKGLIVQADGGTLFLDEIGDMPLSLQTRFLRVLSESEVLPLGADKPLPIRLNVIAATHRDLRESVERGSFREDLYYRLTGATLCLPPLRERSDRRYLVETLFNEEAQKLGVATRLTPAAMQALENYAWPGNVRELRNSLRYALALSGDEPVTVSALPTEIGRVALVGCDAGAEPSSALHENVGTADSGGAHRLVTALRQNKWNITLTARQLDVCRATVYRQMARFRITPPNSM